MGRHTLAAAISVVTILTAFGTNTSQAQDLIWQVENPFRFFKSTRSFNLHEAAYNSVRGNGELPRDIVWRTERRLNDPDCRDSSSPDRCASTAGKRYQQSRLGWAAQTLNDTCYDRNAHPRRYPTNCERVYSWGKAREDYVLPDAHTVNIRIAAERLEGVSGECTWMWRPRRDGGKLETKKQACSRPLTIARVPYAQNKAVSGVSVAVTLPDGTQFAERDVVVEDIFIVSLGDSFGSGESNPDRPVQFSASREMVYDPTLLQEEIAAGPQPGEDTPPPRGFGLSSADDQINPKVLPRRLMEDELAERFLKQSSPAFRTAFDKASAQWLSRDCHRSQYGYAIRTGLQLTLENRHRAVTLATFNCSGAEITAGLFGEMDPREGASEPSGKTVRPQLVQLAELLCRGTPNQQASYTMPVYAAGSTSISAQRFTMSWCPPAQRKRPIDLVMMSIGGNDVGFGGLVAYAMTESASDFAPIAAWIGSSIRFSPNVSRVYMNVLDQRMKALKDALQQGFGVDPSHVLHTSYEPIQYNETGALCGDQPTLGMDVHPGLRLHKGRLQETATFLDDFLARLQCINTGRGRGCSGNMATGPSGTGFQLITDHVPEFAKRGMCARDPRRTFADGNNMRVPRRPGGADQFRPYSPAATLPYAHHWRLFRTPNDAFLAAHTHREGVSVFDILQPAYAGLYSGAIHPTAEGHAIVADYVVRHARTVLEKRSTAHNTAR